MYKQFCKNLKNFIEINKCQQPNIRLQLAKEILFLADVNAYIRYKENNNDKYKEIMNFISNMQKYQIKYPALKKFVWELWGYGFDIEEVENIEQDAPEIMEEKVKIIDLLLGTHYFAQPRIFKT